MHSVQDRTTNAATTHVSSA